MVQRFTRTLNPLHFEDLEPRRFEDLVRQVLYDFRPWRYLEATGRSGSDEGFDIRGWETSRTATPEDAEDELDIEPVAEDRIWLVQCKREKAIGQKKLKDYLAEIPSEHIGSLYGVVFVATCDFSKSARDAFREWAVHNRIVEAHMWGRGELEDIIFRPENDRLLFAYFGISLVVRARSLRTQLRTITTIKRKLSRIMNRPDNPMNYVLFRDPTDDRYPYVDEAERDLPPNERTNRWRIRRALRLTHEGLLVQQGRYFGYASEADGTWDGANRVNLEGASEHEDPWNSTLPNGDEQRRLAEFWSGLPEANRCWTEVNGVVLCEDILEVDEIGDDWFGGCHIFVNWPSVSPNPYLRIHLHFTFFDGRTTEFAPDLEARRPVFPSEFRFVAE